jgi:hypothetical protein
MISPLLGPGIRRIARDASFDAAIAASVSSGVPFHQLQSARGQCEHTVLILARTSPVAGHFDSTSGPDPFHCPSYTPGIVESVGKLRADKTLLARLDKPR